MKTEIIDTEIDEIIELTETLNKHLTNIDEGIINIVNALDRINETLRSLK